MLHYTLIPSHCILVDIERLWSCLAVKLHNFWGPKIVQKGAQSFYQWLFLWKLQPSLLISYYHHWWMFGCFLICRNIQIDFVYINKDFYWFEKWEFIACFNLSMQFCMYAKGALLPWLQPLPGGLAPHTLDPAVHVGKHFAQAPVPGILGPPSHWSQRLDSPVGAVVPWCQCSASGIVPCGWLVGAYKLHNIKPVIFNQCSLCQNSAKKWQYRI